MEGRNRLLQIFPSRKHKIVQRSLMRYLCVVARGVFCMTRYRTRFREARRISRPEAVRNSAGACLYHVCVLDQGLLYCAVSWEGWNSAGLWYLFSLNCPSRNWFRVQNVFLSDWEIWKVCGFRRKIERHSLPSTKSSSTLVPGVHSSSWSFDFVFVSGYCFESLNPVFLSSLENKLVL